MALTFIVLAHSYLYGSFSQDTVFTSAIKEVMIYGSDSRIDTIKEAPVIKYHDGLVFEMVEAPGVEYRYKLNKVDRDWGRWTKNPSKDYTNLGRGNYLFSYQYRGENNNIGEGTFSFRVSAPWYSSRLALVIYPVVLIFLIGLLRIRTNRLIKERQSHLEELIVERTDELRREKEKSDNLLANMLPKGTAEEIMSKGKAAKTKYNFVTVLFSDIQGFTRIAEEMNPEMLIDELDKFFFHFDSVAEKYRIEKIKTIGDAYMCAGGIPERNRTNPVEVVMAALEMQKYMLSMKEDPQNNAAKFWDIRIGIHTGTVVAGVVGHKKLTYDIWGDTVNTASRMESSGEPGKVNISGTTHEFVKEYFDCEYRGRMPVKYKGDLDMYFVTGIRQELCNTDGSPNKRFFSKMKRIRVMDVEEHVLTDYSANASPDLFFHNPDYVRNFCLQAELIAKAENLEDDDYINLRLASIFLFYGYVFDYAHPVEASIKRAEEILIYYGFDDANLKVVKDVIGSAFLPEQKTKMGAVLHDAAFDFLGRVDFARMITRLFKEEMAYGRIKDPHVWFENLKANILRQKFITDSAKLLQTVTREAQTEAIEKLSADILSQL